MGQLTILITACEASGDRLAAPIMAALKQQYPHIHFIGVGGPHMQAQGLTSAFPMADLNVMGFTDVLPALPRILTRLRQLTALAKTQRPALMLTVDGSTFSAALRQRVFPLGIPCVHYVVPKVWAWRQGRVHRLKKSLTHLLAELPLGIELFQNAGVPTTYIGHPSVQALLAMPAPAQQQFQLAMLPGSRTAELQRHWPTMLATFTRLQQLHPQLTGLVVLPTPAHAAKLHAITAYQHLPITVVVGEDRFTALQHCRAALAKSGTVTLELAALRVPTIVIYRMGWLTHTIAKLFVKLPFISLPNIILGTCLFPEFIQHAASPENLTRALHPLLQNQSTKRTQQLFTQLATALHTPQPPAQRAAQILAQYLPK